MDVPLALLLNMESVTLDLDDDELNATRCMRRPITSGRFNT